MFDGQCIKREMLRSQFHGAFDIRLPLPLRLFRKSIDQVEVEVIEASLARLASTMAILLKAGCSLSEALELLERMESGTRAASELGRWRARCAEGRARFTDVAAGGRIFPPMFVWLVAGAGENLAAGFERAAQVYHARAAYRSNVLLYAALPASLLVLGLVILAQMYPLARMIYQLPMLFNR